MRTSLCFAAVALLSVCAVAIGDDAPQLRQRQQAQEKARALAGELISSVLDVQLRQLAENGLKELPIYRDIASMKGNIARMIDDEMEMIVQLLVEAQAGSEPQRLAKFNAAREQVREVVVRLMAERQKLNRRMQVARLAADTKQLLALQSKVHEATVSLPQRKQDERERLTLATIEDQADVGRLFYQLVAALEDVSTWGGPASAGAADGVRIVKAAQIEPELKEAAAALGRAQFPAALTSQAAVIRGLSSLLERLEQAQGVSSGDRAEALRLVRSLRETQQRLRDETRKTTLTERTTQPLIERQSAIQKELGKLAESLASFSTTEPLVEEAKAAAFEAIAQLFEEKQLPAVDQQGRVIANLAQIEKVLEQGIDVEHSDQSADELAAEIERLKSLKEQLAAAAQQQDEATKAARTQPKQAAKHEQQVGETLAATDRLGEFPSTIDAALASAKEKAADAQSAMAKTSTEAAPERQAAAEHAEAAIRHAQAELGAQLADTQRRQKAVEVGELARAAEALERAAAAERQVARLATRAAQQSGLTAEEAAALAQEQQGVAEVAGKIAAGVTNTAPSASKLLESVRPVINDAARQLTAAGEKPGEANKPLAKAAGQSSGQSAGELTKAAAELRREQGRAAEELTKIAGEQLAQAEAARQAVASASADPDDGAAETLARLEQARQQVREAVAEQAKAQGRSEEAAGGALAEQVAAALRQQQAAEQAAQELARGRAKSPLDAAARQQEVADAAGQLGQQATGDVAKSLEQAAKSAAEAARQTLGGNPAKADASRKTTRAALEQAQAAAAQKAKQAASAQPGQPDAAAQASARRQAGEAEKSLRPALSAAGKPGEDAAAALQQASKQAAAAEQSLASGKSAEAKASQDQARQALSQAAEQLERALADLAKQQASRLGEKAQQASALNAQAAQVDPGAAAALAQAAQAARAGAQTGSQRSQTAQAQKDVAQKLEQAEANLAAREQQLRHDRDLAETLAQLAQDQQAARDAIAQAAAELEKMGTPGSPTSSPLNLSQQLAAAQALQQAQQQFAAAQMATGEGAAEVSGQQQVANQPIREGLETASLLNQPPGGQQSAGRQPPSEGAPSGKLPPTGPGSENAGQGAGQGQPSNQGQPGQPGSKGEPGGQGQPSQLGTGLVPNSPQATAQQIAGPQANAAASSAMAAAGQSQGEGQGEQPGQGKGQSNKEGAASSTASKGGAAKGGESANNQDQPKGDLQTAEAPMADSRGELADRDVQSGGLRVESEPWFAKLPPSLRAAIQAKSRGKAPRGYEDRLRRYFESVD